MSASGSNFTAVNYNEKKVKQGAAGLVYFENFGPLQEKSDITKEEFQKYFQDYSARNRVIKNPAFHATCSCRGNELSYEQLKETALEIMRNLGYGDNPILIYEHHDTKNNHVHIVTSRVGENGKKIKDSFEGKRANHHLNAILNREPHQEYNFHMNSALSYKFGTHAQFALLMESKGYNTQKREERLFFFKHGETQGDISLADIDKKIELNAGMATNAAQIKALIHKYRRQYSGELRSNRDNKVKFKTEPKKQLFESDLTNFLKEKFGIDFIFFTGKDKDKPYGYTVIDHNKKEVFKGSEILKLEQLTESGVVAHTLVQDKQEILLSTDFPHSNNESETERKDDYTPDDNLGDALSDFISELERMNQESAQGRRKIKKHRRM